MNCLIIDDDPIIQKQLSAFVTKSDLLELKGSFKNPTEAFPTLKDGDIDIVFLDIEMPEMSGLEFLDEIENEFAIIIISGDRKYALDTFEYDVTDYLLKPVEYSRFIKSVNRAVERNIERNSGIKKDRIFIKILNSFVRIFVDDIISVENGKDKKTIITKKKSFNVMTNLFDTSVFVGKENFFKINDAFIVNLNEISDVCDNYLIFKNRDVMDKVCVEANTAREISQRIGNVKA
ncbi:MAG: response regulator transcription factor [Bacteroidales bacterium]|jgi:DNA-binding LytR/AlgR family response regulator|nr:response regulator transcription factor [Bacteroidales bacterium]